MKPPALTDNDVKAAFLSAANNLLAFKAEVIANGKEMVDVLFITDELECDLSQRAGNQSVKKA
ncbi:MAG: hypothetical protein ACI4CS_01860 [Candidatus Weimeria sp.]